MVDQDLSVAAPDSSATDQVLVSFKGHGAGVGELSWGQRELWGFMQRMNTWHPIGAVLDLAPGTTLEDAVTDLRFAMSNYPSMRTRLLLEPWAQPKQVVADSGVIPLEIVDAADSDDPAEVAAAVFNRYRDSDYDFAKDWPVRVAVIRHRGVLTHQAWVMSHLVTDGVGGLVILREMAKRDASASRSCPAPLEQAAWQASPAGQRQSRGALRYWEKTLRDLPARRFPPRSERPYPRYWQGVFTSRALHLAARTISLRTGAEVPSVLLALFSVALARITGINPVASMTVVSNRFRPGLADTVSPIMQTGLAVIDVQDSTVDEVVRHTKRRVMTTYKNAYYDPLHRDALIARINRERGELLDLTCVFNDRRLTRNDGSGPPAELSEVLAAAEQTGFRWTHQQDEHEFEGFAVNVDDVPDLVQLTVTCDIHYVSPDDVEATLRGMEELAIGALRDPDRRTGVAPAGAVTTG